MCINIKMDFMRKILPVKLYESLERAQICTPKEILTLSTWDIKKLSGLRIKDIELLRNTVAKHITPLSVGCNTLVKNDRVKSGCAAIDNLLRGGFRKGVLTEIYGESGSGKTQLGMQLSANNSSHGWVYICTEDLFPIKRYNQIQQCIDQTGNNMFIEHVYEALDLLSCMRIRLPKLLEKHEVSLVIVDSVAAPFRFESNNYIQRAEELRELAITLLKIAQENNIAIICINQVTSNFNDSLNKPLPSLGLAWSNVISYRLWLKKCTSNELPYHADEMVLRELKIVFAPDLPNNSCNFLITSKGITDL